MAKERELTNQGKDFLNSLNSLVKAWHECSLAWEQLNPDEDELVNSPVTQYPFDKNFDELWWDVMHWTHGIAFMLTNRERIFYDALNDEYTTETELLDLYKSHLEDDCAEKEETMNISFNEWIEDLIAQEFIVRCDNKGLANIEQIENVKGEQNNDLR